MVLATPRFFRYGADMYQLRLGCHLAVPQFGGLTVGQPFLVALSRMIRSDNDIWDGSMLPSRIMFQLRRTDESQKARKSCLRLLSSFGS